MLDKVTVFIDRYISRICTGIFLSAVGLRLAHIFYFFDKDWEMDTFGHFIKIEESLANIPSSLWKLLDVWAKPLYTATFALVMWLLPEATRLLPVVQTSNALFWCGSCFLMFRALENSLKERFGSLAKISFLLVALFTFVPFRGSVSGLTEPLGALLIGLSILCFQKRQLKTASFFVGLCILSRIDALMMTAILLGFTFLLIILEDGSLADKSKRIVLIGVAGILPLCVWCVLCYLWKGDFLLIFNTYPKQAGIMGYGKLFWYYDMFKHTDKAFTLLYCLSPLLLLDRKLRGNPLFLMCLLQSTLYFCAMTYLWVTGAASLSGMQRYFIVALPFFLVCTGFVLARIFELLQSASGRAGPVLSLAAAVLLAASLYSGLKPLTEKPAWHSRQWTAIGEYDIYYNLKSIQDIARGKTIYADAEGVAYYLRTDRKHLIDLGGLAKIKDPAAKGIFVYVVGWSDHYSHLGLEDFFACSELIYQQDERIFVFEKK